MVNGVLIGETFLLPLRAAGGALSDAGYEVGRAFEALLLHELDAGPPADIRRKPKMLRPNADHGSTEMLR